MLSKRECERISKGFNRNLNHNPVSSCVHINDTFGLLMKPILVSGVEGQSIGGAAVIYFQPPLQMKPAKFEFDKFALLTWFKNRAPEQSRVGYLSLLCHYATLDHEREHFKQLLSNRALREYERIERQITFSRLLKSSRMNELREFATPLLFPDESMPSSDLWILETYPVANQYQYLTYPNEVHEQEVEIGRWEVTRTENVDFDFLCSRANKALGSLFLEVVKDKPNHLNGWKLACKCANVFVQAMGTTRTELDLPAAAEIANYLIIFKGLGLNETVKNISNLEPKWPFIFSENQIEGLRHLGIDLPEWKTNLINHLKKQVAYFEQFDLQGSKERYGALLDIAKKIPSESQARTASDFFTHLSYRQTEVFACEGECFVQGAIEVEETVNVFAGGFIDAGLSDQMLDGKRLRCPFAMSRQNIWGCLDCTGFIDGEGLNHRCQHAKRWLE